MRVRWGSAGNISLPLWGRARLGAPVEISLPLRGRVRVGACLFHRWLDVDPPAGQLRRQTSVLPILSDSQGELVFGHLGGRRPGLAVDLHGEHLGWAERIGDQLRRFIRPRDDVDPLRPKLANHTADPYPARADAGAHWVDALLVC